MEFRISRAVLVLLFVASPVFAMAAIAQPGQDCHLRGSEGGLRCHAIGVPLDPQKPSGPQLQVHVTVAPAFRQSASVDPVFVLAGGPGQAGSDVASTLGTMFQRLRATRDIVFIDQRGTGRSGKLRCANNDIADIATRDELMAAFATCVKELKHPPAMYSTANAAHDIESVRVALGYGKVNVFGASYGTRLAQHYARSYPANVRTLILDGVASPEQVIPAGASDAQLALDGVFQRCASDKACAKAFPELKSEFDTLMARVNRGDVKLDFAHPRTAERTRVTLTNTRFVSAIHTSLYVPHASQRLPYMIHNAYQGNWGPFIARAFTGNDVSPEGQLSMPLYLSVVCGEDVPRMTPALREADERASFMRGRAELIASFCPLLNVPAAPVQAAAPIAAPVLLLSGALDPVTPPHRAIAAAKAMPKAQHLIVAQAGHGVSSLGCAPRLLREFLDQPGQPLVARCLNDIAPVTFQLGHAGTQP
jgi:pimeloyl-ACP methyl ester carboxylesterase